MPYPGLHACEHQAGCCWVAVWDGMQWCLVWSPHCLACSAPSNCAEKKPRTRSIHYWWGWLWLALPASAPHGLDPDRQTAGIDAPRVETPKRHLDTQTQMAPDATSIAGKRLASADGTAAARLYEQMRAPEAPPQTHTGWPTIKRTVGQWTDRSSRSIDGSDACGAS